MTVRVLEGDCRTVLATLPDASVQCVVTSPPYFGLRDHGTASWDGGDPGCDHLNGPLASPKSTLQGYTSDQVKLAIGGMPFKDFCGKCGARRVDKQIGLEASVEEYVTELVAVFREVRRVLRDDGVLFLNLGDSYNAYNGNRGGSPSLSGAHVDRPTLPTGYGLSDPTLKPKDLIGVPWMVAFALRSDGWYLRSDIIWAKPNPMPESVRDRPTKAHEYIFLLTKSPRYFWDAEAVKEVAICDRKRGPNNHAASKEARGTGNGHDGLVAYRDDENANRNLRSVWTIATAPFAEAHFATFPPALAERCIKAGTSEKGACPVCGSPWGRVVEDTEEYAQFKASLRGRRGSMRSNELETLGLTVGTSNPSVSRESRTTGWQPTCTCPPHDPIPCVVLDPFAGAGTTALVADRLGRDSIAVELNPAYVKMIRKRVTNDAPLFAQVV